MILLLHRFSTPVLTGHSLHFTSLTVNTLHGTPRFTQHYLINGTIFEKKKSQNTKCVFWFSVQIWNISHSEKNWSRYGQKCTGCSCKVPLFVSDFNDTWIFEKCSDIKFHENRSSGSRVVRCRRTDRHDEGNSRFSQLRERAKEPTCQKTHCVSFTTTNRLVYFLMEIVTFLRQ